MGVEEFLQSIANAELVLTDSYHAAAFSSILKTPFYALPRFKAQDKTSMNSRILNLAQELEIPERYTDKFDARYEWRESELKNIESNLLRMKNCGLDYFQKALYE